MVSHGISPFHPVSALPGEVNNKLGQIVEDVDANGYPPVETYREIISEFADQALCGLTRSPCSP